MLPAKKKVDISSFSKEEKEIFEKYGKVPSSKALLANKLKERKYFDSGDYAMSKAGVTTHHNVGTAIPSPADIPHASPPAGATSPTAIPGSISTSPTGSFQLGTSPTSSGKEPVGGERASNMTFAQ